MGHRKDYQSVAFRERRIKEFWERIDKSGGVSACWPWMGPTLKRTGYGHAQIAGQQGSAHRFAYEFSEGKITDGMFVLHKCDNKICCNPAHLFLGDQRTNIADMVQKNRQATGEFHGMAVLTARQVLDIRASIHAGTKHKTLASIYSVSVSAISRIGRRTSWKKI